MYKHDVMIIGGGASGVFAAVHAAKRGAETIIVERNDRLMRKLGITGKGRCNLTNNTDIDTMMRNVPSNGRFLYSAFSACEADYVMSFFENLGVSLKTERGNRVFPVSDRAGDIVTALKKEAERLKIKVIHDRVKSISSECGIFSIKGEEDIYNAAKVILATGGLSYPKTGSTGDGYRIAAELRHNIIPPKPSLVPVVADEDVSVLAGLSLRNICVSLYDRMSKRPKTPVYKEQGEMLFTHSALSGPLILTLSSHIQKAESGRFVISIDLKPALDEKELDNRVLRDFREYKNRWFINSLDKLLPAKLIPLFAERVGIEPQKRVNEITKDERKRIIKTFKNFEFNFRDFLSFDSAVITAGGVDIREINPKTMESRLIPGLYFCGEVMNVSALTGGFNLHIAFSTAKTAALAAVPLC